MKHALLFAAFLAASPLSAFAHGYEVGSILIDHPMVIAAPATAMATGGYMTLTNSGTEPDRLVAISSPLAKTELHESTVDENGVARMQHLDAVDLPPGAVVSFAPGGLHVMFTELTTGLEDGASVPVTLTFEVAGPIDVEFRIEAKPGTAHGASHDGAAMDGAAMDGAATHDHASHDHAALDTSGMEPAEAIRATMMAMFDKPEAPLAVPVVVLAGDHALADWSQGAMGGRAFLTLVEGQWQITFCSGAGLKEAAVLEQLGVAQADAETLTAALAKEEASLTPADIALFDSFEGMVRMDGKDS